MRDIASPLAGVSSDVRRGRRLLTNEGQLIAALAGRGDSYILKPSSGSKVSRTGSGADATHNQNVGWLTDITGNAKHFPSPSDTNLGVLNVTSGVTSVVFNGTSTEFVNANLSFASMASMSLLIRMKTTDNQFMMAYNGSARYLVSAWEANAGTSLNAGAGTPAYYINGALFTGTTRGQLRTALATGAILTLEVRGFSLATSWTNLSFGNYPSGSWPAAYNLYGMVMGPTSILTGSMLAKAMTFLQEQAP